MDGLLLTLTAAFFSYLIKVLIVLFKGVLILAILRACHYGIEDDNHGSINQRSVFSQILVTLLFIGLSFMGIIGVYLSHVGLFLGWLILRPVIKVLDLENPMCTAVAVGIIACGSATCLATYHSVEQLVTQHLLVM